MTRIRPFSNSLPAATLLLAASLAVSCIKPTQCDLKPRIEFVDFTPIGDEAVLRLSFEDGDGDLGLKENETAAPYDYNLFMAYFEKVNGVFVEDTSLEPPFWYRIPYLNAEQKERCVSGEISITITPFFRNFMSPESDTIMFRIYIRDRALNESNTVETPEVITP